MGVFANIEDEDIRGGNEDRNETQAAQEFRIACQDFLRNTRGLKLKPGPLTMRGRQAWSSVLQALDALERYEDVPTP